jgi:adenylate kinase
VSRLWKGTGEKLSPEIVFVGGIHGAGKTTVSSRLAVALSGSHVTAGTLIRECARSETITTGVGNKAVPDVNANQHLLLRGLAVHRRHASGPIVLDGHFSLMDPTGMAVAIPMDVYTAISPIAIVLIEADSAVVHSRLLQRDGAAPPLTAIESLSDRERSHAHAVSRALKIPMLAVRGDIPAEEASNTAASQLLPLLCGAA